MSAMFDVTIVGGGMVGASLAVALAPLGLSVALVEAIVHDAVEHQSFDERTTALSNASRRILDTLGVWREVADQATPIRMIHVSDQGRFGFARIDAREQGLEAMGFVLPNRLLGRALWARIATLPGIRVFCPAQVADVAGNTECVEFVVNESGGGTSRLATRLIVAADGASSSVRTAFGVIASKADYGQTAVICTVLPQHFHEHVAYERFTADGPLALLPGAQGRCTLVLTLAPERAAQAMQWSEQQFLSEVQARFGFRLGRILQAGRRGAYPLALTQSEQTSAGRCVIIGNAAQGLHPVAGMGFNLGLRDVACLAEVLAQCAAPGAREDRRCDDYEHGHHAGHDDCGNAGLLAEYDSWRAGDRRGIIAFTDSLVRVFSSPSAVIARLRNLGLLAFDLLPPAKAALSRLSTGADAGSRVPKLARGVALQSARRSA